MVALTQHASTGFCPTLENPTFQLHNLIAINKLVLKTDTNIGKYLDSLKGLKISINRHYSSSSVTYQLLQKNIKVLPVMTVNRKEIYPVVKKKVKSWSPHKSNG